MDKTELRKLIRHCIEQLTLLRLKVSAELLTNEVTAVQIGSVLDSLKESMELMEGTKNRKYALLPVQITSNEDKIARLNEEIAELEEFTLLSSVNHTYDIQKLGKMRRAIEDLKEYRGLLEGDIQKKYTGHPSYKLELDDNMILSKYKELKSFRAVAKALGCSHHTVKERLIRMGHIKE